MKVLKRNFIGVALATAMTLAASSVASAGIMFATSSGDITGINIRAFDQIANIADTDDVSVAVGAAVPQTGTLTADTNPGGPSAQAALDYSLGDSGFSFDFSASSRGNPNGGDGDVSFGSNFYFTVDEDTDFTFSATASGASNSGGGASGSLFSTFFHAFVAEIFASEQQSGSASSAYLIEADGAPGGAAQNVTRGTFTGQLQAGKIYHLAVSGGGNASFTAANGGDFSASMSLVLSGANSAPVPAPTTATLLMFAALIVNRRGHRPVVRLPVRVRTARRWQVVSNWAGVTTGRDGT